MKTFSGFPSGKVPIVGVPKPVFTELLPIIDDLAELKLTLHVLWRLGQQRGKTPYLRFQDLASDEVLLSSLQAVSEDSGPVDVLRASLNRAVERGTLLRAESPDQENPTVFYFVNTSRGRSAVGAIISGDDPDRVETGSRPNIFSLYEQNIGILTPLIAEELREAEKSYPYSWIEEATREAVRSNKRSWRYVQAILERWRREGKGDDSRSQRGDEIDRKRYLEWTGG